MSVAAQHAACRQFVDAFAEIETYGGGKRAQLWLGKELIVAYDAWKGEAHARERLAEVLLRRMGVQDPLPEAQHG